MWYLSPKNWLIAGLLMMGIVVGGLYLWQKVEVKSLQITIAKQDGEISSLNVVKVGLEGQVKDYQTNIANMKKLQSQHQKVEDDSIVLLEEINTMLDTKCIGGKDEETISDITFFFNSRGLLSAGSTKADGEVLPETDKTNFSGWSTRQLVENYLILVEYALKLEGTVACYESN
jgi:hypothetical protein